MLFQGKDGVDVEVLQVLFKKLPAAMASITADGQISLLSRCVALLTRATGLCSDNVELWDLYADFMEGHVRAGAAAMLEIRLNTYRSCQKEGWASNAQAFPVVVGKRLRLIFLFLFPFLSSDRRVQSTCTSWSRLICWRAGLLLRRLCRMMTNLPCSSAFVLFMVSHTRTFSHFYLP